MDSSLVPSYFFDLSQFEHARLFENCPYVWQALDAIKGYIASYHSLGSIKGTLHEGSFLLNPETIFIGEGTVVEPGAYIKGPCIIGKQCQIRHGAYIRGDVIIGDHCVIGHTTEMKGAIMCDHSNAAHFAYVCDSIIGSYVNIGAGAKCANLRLDNRSVVIHANGQKIDSKRRKLGSIIGDRCQIGCNSVLNPGTLFGKHASCFPCVNVMGMVPAHHTVKPSTKAQIITS